MLSKVKAWRRQVDAFLAKRETSEAALKRARHAVIEGEEEYDTATEAQQIVQAVAETIQQEAHSRLAGVVTRCIANVFPDNPYTFAIRFEQARGRTEAHLVFVRDGMEVNPTDASGGGVVDVGAFALRASSLMLSRPSRRWWVALDEPFKFVSAGHRVTVRAMLEQLAKDLGMQFVQVTHIDELRCGSIVELG